MYQLINGEKNDSKKISLNSLAAPLHYAYSIITKLLGASLPFGTPLTLLSECSQFNYAQQIKNVINPTVKIEIEM